MRAGRLDRLFGGVVRRNRVRLVWDARGVTFDTAAEQLAERVCPVGHLYAAIRGDEQLLEEALVHQPAYGGRCTGVLLGAATGNIKCIV
ncbi:hypothetical protein BBK82_13595 [Lentzea guizhouensis]|uniref:Uncharacterized protein n=2 Tax=Lentzea guizhouensis TaxID=1586287 RepID=A0A1B2HGW1_9PSEU|nr:hypothetical protein BBK82_13595 [Lentzea guizhouensis]